MSFLGSLRDIGAKVETFFANPGQSARVVSNAVSNVLAGRSVTPTVIHKETPTLGSVLATPVVVTAGVVGGEVGGLLRSAGHETLGRTVTDHPVATTALLGAAGLGGATALGYAANGLFSGAGTAAAGVAQAGGGIVDAALGRTTPKAAKAKKRKPAKRKAKKPKKRARRRASHSKRLHASHPRKRR